MEKRGLHLDGAERAVIFAEHRRGASQREIALAELSQIGALWQELAQEAVGVLI